MKWAEDALDEVEIAYVHRGAPGDERIVSGRDVVDLGHSFFGLRTRGGRTASIPYHRVLRIERGGTLVWERRPTPPPAPPVERETGPEPASDEPPPS